MKSYKEKEALLKNVTGHGTEYWIESYVDKFYENYELILKIKNAIGSDGLEKLYDMVNSELGEVMSLIRYIGED